MKIKSVLYLSSNHIGTFLTTLIIYLANFGINVCLIMSSLVHLDSLFQYYGHVYKHHFATKMHCLHESNTASNRRNILYLYLETSPISFKSNVIFKCKIIVFQRSSRYVAIFQHCLGNYLDVTRIVLLYFNNLCNHIVIRISRRWRPSWLQYKFAIVIAVHG